jgi:CDP-diacylglycerol pyrophosphatase
MKKTIRLNFAVVSVLILTVVILMALPIYFFVQARSYVPSPVYSVDGSRVIISTINSNKEDYVDYLFVHIEIQDVKTGKALSQIQTRASSRMRWSIEWIGNDTVKLDSSDIGSYCWTESDNGVWSETKCP